jgi:hypothetical protein
MMPLPKYNPFTFNSYTFDLSSIERMTPEERAELRAYILSDPEEEQRQVIAAFGELGRRMGEAHNRRVEKLIMDTLTPCQFCGERFIAADGKSFCHCTAKIEIHPQDS